MTIDSRLSRIERALRIASESPPSDDEVRWAYRVTDRYADLMIRQMMAEDDERLGVSDEQIEFLNSVELARAQAICDRHQKARGIGSINFEANPRLPKHDLADMEAERSAFDVAAGPVPAGVAEV